MLRIYFIQCNYFIHFFKKYFHLTHRLGKNIQLIRKNFGQTQEEFADEMGLTRGRMQSYEQDKVEPPLDFLLFLEEITEIPIYDLIMREFTVKEIKQSIDAAKVKQKNRDHNPDQVDSMVRFHDHVVTHSKRDLYNFNELVKEVQRLNEEVQALKKRLDTGNK